MTKKNKHYDIKTKREKCVSSRENQENIIYFLNEIE